MTTTTEHRVNTPAEVHDAIVRTVTRALHERPPLLITEYAELAEMLGTTAPDLTERVEQDLRRVTSAPARTRYAGCRTLMDLGEQFHADVDLKSALGDMVAVRSLVAEYRARRIELTGAGR